MDGIGGRACVPSEAAPAAATVNSIFMASSRRPPSPGYFRNTLPPWWRPRPPLDRDFGLEDLFREHLESPEEESEEEEEDEAWIEPCLFYDEKIEAANAEWLKREAERKKREEEKAKWKAEEWKRREEELVRCAKEHRAVMRSIHRYDPKEKTVMYTRFPFANSFADLNDESPYPPMRNTNKKNLPMFYAANILTINIVSSDVGFPIDVYGTAIARDNLDYFKCVYLFRCHRRDSQCIKSEDESLIMTGPARGLILSDFIYLEVDLKIKGARGQDKQLSKGLLEIDGRVLKLTRLKTNDVRQVTCASQLSTVEAKFTVVKNAVEATVEIHVLWGYFHGQISAHTSRFLDEFVLFKGETGGVFTSDGSRLIPLWRRIVNVCLTEKLFFTIETRDGTKLLIESTPATHGSDCYECPFGSETFRVNVTWSAT